MKRDTLARCFLQKLYVCVTVLPPNSVLKLVAPGAVCCPPGPCEPHGPQARAPGVLLSDRAHERPLLLGFSLHDGFPNVLRPSGLL